MCFRWKLRQFLRWIGSDSAGDRRFSFWNCSCRNCQVLEVSGKKPEKMGLEKFGAGGSLEAVQTKFGNGYKAYEERIAVLECSAWRLPDGTCFPSWKLQFWSLKEGLQRVIVNDGCPLVGCVSDFLRSVFKMIFNYVLTVALGWKFGTESFGVDRNVWSQLSSWEVESCSKVSSLHVSSFLLDKLNSTSVLFGCSGDGYLIPIDFSNKSYKRGVYRVDSWTEVQKAIIIYGVADSSCSGNAQLFLSTCVSRFLLIPSITALLSRWKGVVRVLSI